MPAVLAISLALALEGAAPAPAPATVPAEALNPPAPEEPVETAEASPAHRHLASWLLLGAGAAGLLTGGALNLASANAANTTPVALQTGVPYQTPQAQSLWTGALISYSVGAALGLAGAVAYYLESR
ncbi:MAG: hypothetical protein ACYDCL_06740 [Myxococcales bacterium]